MQPASGDSNERHLQQGIAGTEIILLSSFLVHIVAEYLYHHSLVHVIRVKHEAE